MLTPQQITEKAEAKYPQRVDPDIHALRQQQAYISAYKDCHEEMSKECVSVKDRLPEIGNYVLLALKSSFVVLDKCESDGNYSSPWDSYNSTKVTHWMPLPEPPTSHL